MTESSQPVGFPLLRFEKHIFDPLHGYIGITEPEECIVNNMLFQRTHHLRQLGPAYLVYPTATHTRFSHMLGALNVMTEFCRNIRYYDKDELIFSDKEELQKLRIAALLHDVGHYPLSHILEEAMEIIAGEEKLKGYFKHEAFGQHIILKTGMRDTLNASGYKPAEIVEILTGQAKVDEDRKILYQFFLDSDLDVDKTDYLLRDSYFTGVGYGQVAADRLMNTITYSKDDGIVFKKTTEALENFLIGRVHMYQTVYFHKVVYGFELMVKHIYKMLYDENKEVYGPSQVFELEDSEIHAFDDNYFYSKLVNYKGNNEYLRDMIRMLRERHPLAMSISSRNLMTAKKTNKDALLEFLLQPNGADQLKREISAKSSVDEKWIFPERIPYKQLLNDKLSKTKIAIKVVRDKKVIPLDQDEGSIVHVLQQYRSMEARVYTKKDVTDKVEQATRQILIK